MRLLNKTSFCILLLFMACNPMSNQAVLQSLKVQQIDFQPALTTIALGSCNDEDKDQEIWQFIEQNDPDLWIWLGDNIYGDTEDMTVMAAKYDKQLSHPAYQKFIANRPVIGTWDDHDYGVNNGGKEYKPKAESKRLMLDFLGVPSNASVRKRAGAYQSFNFGTGKQQVKIILLDARTFRDPMIKDPSGKRNYMPNKEGDVLGEQQWKWLADELKNSQAEINIIATGIQLIAEEQNYEKWANFPVARKRLLALIHSTQVKHPIVISGDRHMAELATIKLDSDAAVLYELTSSGLTHSWTKGNMQEDNKYRVGNLVPKRNFGMLRIDWNAKPIQITAEIRGMQNRLYLQQVLKY